ncbi:MAG: histidine phosphatase family protein, partial [Acidimicrobiaceae bacterium]|nr:histidine phosphatase family protein [Acidimicrobiaceae bacterium]
MVESRDSPPLGGDETGADTPGPDEKPQDLAEGASRLYLARHGRTPLNAAGVLRGRLDPPLDEEGRAEAARLGSALGGVGVRLVVASPLQR